MAASLSGVSRTKGGLAACPPVDLAQPDHAGSRGAMHRLPVANPGRKQRETQDVAPLGPV